MNPPVEQNLSFGRNIKIALFHLGSGMADVISTGIWNRVMISDLGFSATPIGLLVSLRYFLAPLGVWAGRMSDERSIGGYRRLFWIWLGRAMMALSTIMLGLVTADLARGAAATPLIWLSLASALVLFSLGSALSGSTFLALVYDRSPAHQRGRVVGIVWTFLLLGLAIGGPLFATMLPTSKEAAAGQHQLSFTPETLQTLFIVAALLMAALWFFSLLGEERRNVTPQVRQEKRDSSLRADLELAWNNRQTRYFFWFLALSMMFAFSQDLVLEPFAGDVFKMDAARTSRFTEYWGTMAIVGTLVFLWLGRRHKRLTNTRLSYIGVGVLIVTFALLAISSFASIQGLLTPGLLLLGVGLGVWNVGALGLMMEMSPFGRAGTFLGFWTLVVTLARGLGVSGGGIVRDLVLGFTASPEVSYGAVFLIGGIGLAVSVWTLTRVQVEVFQAEQGEATASDSAGVLAGALE
jgi:MFS transporter, BCD family, chlorophyll transporter